MCCRNWWGCAQRFADHDGLKMMKQIVRLSIATLVLTLLGLAGCSGLQLNGAQAQKKASAEQAAAARNARPLADFKPVTVRASGYGVAPDDPGFSAARRHLMAMRASKLDAYRALAERVYGTVIYGGSTVNDFVLHNDRFRTFIDSYIRGAKVISVDNEKDGVVETTMQLKLEPRFQACVSGLTEREVARDCPIPMPDVDDAAGDIQTKDHQLDSLYYLDP